MTALADVLLALSMWGWVGLVSGCIIGVVGVVIFCTNPDFEKAGLYRDNPFTDIVTYHIEMLTKTVLLIIGTFLVIIAVLILLIVFK